MFQALLCIFIFFVVSFIINERRSHKTFVSQIRIPNKVVIVTGADTGIGYETAKELSRRAGRVILACRNLPKAQRLATEIKAATGYEVVAKYLDLASFRTIVEFAKDIKKTEGRVDILVNNADTGLVDSSLTEDGLPRDAQVNYFGRFFLTLLLLPAMKNLSETARIINVTSAMHIFGTVENLDKPGKNFLARRRVYANTKLANVLFTQKLAEQVFLRNNNIIVNCCHTGPMYSDMFRNQPKQIQYLSQLFFQTPRQGAQTPIYLAAQEMTPGIHTSGRYYTNCDDDTSFNLARDREERQKLWDLSLRVCFNMGRW